nr:integrase, catalytic region, zinc finger, CCHC-type, peptidase aspartic, catalytic [Tanacetum cinerariifolium]
MSRDVITVGSTMRIPLLYRGEYSQWRERFMNYLEEQTDVINDLKKCGYKKDNRELNYKFLNNLQPEWKQYDTLMRQTKNLMDINIDALYNILKQNQGDVNDALGYKKKAVMVTSDPLALVAKKMKVSKQKEKVVVSLDSEGSGVDDFSELKKIIDLLAKDFNRRKFYSKPTSNNLRTASTSQSANKKQEFVKSDDKKEDKKADEKKRDISKVKYYNCKKEGHFGKDCKKAKEINAIMVFMAQIKKALSESDESSSSAEETIAEVAYYTSESEINTFKEQNNEFNEQTKVLNKKNNDLLDQTKVLKDQLQVKHVVIDTHVECHEKYAKLKEERYEYMIRYSALCDNAKQHRKKIDEQEILFDKMSRQLVEMNNNVLRLQEKILKKETKISELEGCISIKDVEIEKCLERLIECFENPSYFEKEKDLRPSLYDEKVIGLVYTPMFLIHSDEALEIKKFKRARENKIEFAYDYGNLNASYVNEKISFSDDYFQEIINPHFEKIDSPFQQTSSLKPYVPNLILEKIIIDLEDEVVSLLEKEKANLKTIKSLKSKDFDTFSSVRRSKHSSVIWKKKWSSNTSNVDLSFIVQICLWIIDSGCLKHMMGNHALLTNFVEKFLGTVRFGNNDFVVIAGYGDVVIGSMTIKKVYYVKGLGHNLFSVGQFCDKGLEVTFRKSTRFVRNEDGLPKIKFEKDHSCFACEQGKIHQKHHKSKPAFASNKPLYLLHMDLCGSMRIESINEKRYVLVVVDDYSRYTWRVRTDNDTEFKNKTLAKFFDE